MGHLVKPIPIRGGTFTPEQRQNAQRDAWYRWYTAEQPNLPVSGDVVPGSQRFGAVGCGTLNAFDRMINAVRAKLVSGELRIREIAMSLEGSSSSVVEAMTDANRSGMIEVGYGAEPFNFVCGDVIALDVRSVGSGTAVKVPVGTRLTKGRTPDCHRSWVAAQNRETRTQTSHARSDSGKGKREAKSMASADIAHEKRQTRDDIRAENAAKYRNPA